MFNIISFCYQKPYKTLQNENYTHKEKYQSVNKINKKHSKLSILRFFNIKNLHITRKMTTFVSRKRKRYKKVRVTS